MSTNKHDSDSEDDDDYIPLADADSDSSEDEPGSEAVQPLPHPVVDEAEKKKARDALWTSFQESVTAPHLPSPPELPKQMIKVEKRYRFAGEDVVEVVEVTADSPDAKKWPLWREPEPERTPPVASGSGTQPETSTSTSSAVDTPSTTPVAAKPPATRPGPRKPKVSLAAIPSKQTAKKLSTLDKSAMDWRAHVQEQEGSGLKDELEANRRGGGYLEKVDFLKRVDERKEEAIEASRSSKRRKL